MAAGFERVPLYFSHMNFIYTLQEIPLGRSGEKVDIVGGM
jgi:hypothetical protein